MAKASAQQVGRGEIWDADLDPVRGHEQGGRRPVLVVSVDLFNRGPAGLVIVVPLSTRDKGVRSQVRIDPPEGGLSARSFARTEAIRSIAVERLVRRRGAVGPAVMGEVDDRLRMLLGL